MVLTIVKVSMAEQPQTIGGRLRLLRERHGWSLAQLGGRSEVDPTTIWKIESGMTANPGHKTLVRIAGALGVDPSEITGERPVPRRQRQILEGAVGLPVYKRRVHAGGEGYWGDTEDTLWVPHEFLRRYPRARVAVVDGTCMSPFVEQGEKIVLDPDQKPVDGQMVVVTTDLGETLLKWYRLDALGRPFLRSADGQEMRPNGAKIEGVVIEMRRGAVRDPEA